MFKGETVDDIVYQNGRNRIFYLVVLSSLNDSNTLKTSFPYFFFFSGEGYTCYYLGIIPKFALRNYFWLAQRIIWDARGQTKVCQMQQSKHLLIVLSEWPLIFHFFYNAFSLLLFCHCYYICKNTLESQHNMQRVGCFALYTVHSWPRFDPWQPHLFLLVHQEWFLEWFLEEPRVSAGHSMWPKRPNTLEHSRAPTFIILLNN